MKKLSDLLNTFLNSFHFLSKSLKKIFRFIQHHSRKYRNVFPKIETICSITGYSPSTVKRATRYFAKMGWIAKIKRPWQTNVYFMAEDLIRIDLNNSHTFKRDFISQNDPIDDPVLKTSSVYISSSKEQARKEPKNNFKKDKPILHCVQIRALNPKQMQDLSNTCSEYQLTHAIEDAKWYREQGNIILDWGGWLWTAAQKYL